MLLDESKRQRSMGAISAILREIDVLILRNQDKGFLMPHLPKLVMMFDYLSGLENAEKYMVEQACIVQLLAHCVAEDEHRSKDLLAFDNSVFGYVLQNSLQADSRKAHRENVARDRKSVV